jgi:hypothetical protein
MGGRPVVRTVPTQKNIIQKDVDKQPCLKWDLNPHSQYYALDSADTVTGLSHIVQ